MEATEVIVVITGLIAVLVSLAGVMTSARRSAFEELQKVVEKLEQRLINEEKRREKLETELKERDEIIADLKDWIERLIRQLAKHAPAVTPEAFLRRIDLRIPHE